MIGNIVVAGCTVFTYSDTASIIRTCVGSVARGLGMCLVTDFSFLVLLNWSGPVPLLEYPANAVSVVGVAPGASEVTVSLPLFSEPMQDLYMDFTVEWRLLGTAIWQSAEVPSSTPVFKLPGTFEDGRQYEVRVWTQGPGGDILGNVPLTFTTRSFGK